MKYLDALIKMQDNLDILEVMFYTNQIKVKTFFSQSLKGIFFLNTKIAQCKETVSFYAVFSTFKGFNQAVKRHIHLSLTRPFQMKV